MDKYKTIECEFFVSLCNVEYREIVEIIVCDNENEDDKIEEEYRDWLGNAIDRSWIKH